MANSISANAVRIVPTASTRSAPNLTAQFFMSERSNDCSDADRAQQDPVVLRALAGSPGDQRQETPIRCGERIDRNGAHERRPEAGGCLRYA